MSKVPTPVGYRVLVKIVEAPDKIGSIFVPQNAKDAERHLAQMGEVVDIGPLAFQGEQTGGMAWFAVGDTIMFSKYAGARFKVEDVEYRILNDDEALAIVPDWTAIKRA